MVQVVVVLDISKTIAEGLFFWYNQSNNNLLKNMVDEELKKIVKENRQILDKLDEKIKRIEKRFIWSSIFGFIKILIIVAPIVLGIVYLTPFLQDFISIYDPIIKNLPLTIQNFNADSQINANNQQMIESFCNPEARQAMIDQFCK